MSFLNKYSILTFAILQWAEFLPVIHFLLPVFGPHPVQRQMLLLFSHRLHLVVPAVVFCPRTAASVCLTGRRKFYTCRTSTEARVIGCSGLISKNSPDFEHSKHSCWIVESREGLPQGHGMHVCYVERKPRSSYRERAADVLPGFYH